MENSRTKKPGFFEKPGFWGRSNLQTLEHRFFLTYLTLVISS